MLKQLIIISSAAAVVMLGSTGIASAHGHGHHGSATNCTSNDTAHQSNKGHQVLGGNLTAQDAATNVWGAQASRPAGVCPNLLNNNHL